MLASTLLLACAALLLGSAPAHSQERLLEATSKTLGGPMMFTDLAVYQGWRVQKNGMIGNYRLIDPKDHRYTVGSLEHCLASLDQVKAEQQLPPLPKRVVVVVHGHGSARQLMDGMSESLEQGGLAVVNVGYSSTMGDISHHAASLLSVIQHLDGVQQIDFVAHSMGNIVVRHCLGDIARMPPAARPRVVFGRFVMIAPPNHGAVAADTFGGNKLALWIGGDAIKQLAPNKGWPALEQKLVVPQFEFGILVGGKGDDEGYLSGIPGDDDMMLSVQTSLLAGATDTAQVKDIHQKLPHNELVQQCTLRYLKSGAFLESGVRTPIPARQLPPAPL